MVSEQREALDEIIVKIRAGRMTHAIIYKMSLKEHTLQRQEMLVSGGLTGIDRLQSLKMIKM